MQLFHTNKKKIGWGALLATLTWLLQPAAFAQSDQEILNTVKVCQQVPELSARLACYDRILPPGAEMSANTGRASSAPAAVPPAPVQRAERERQTTVIPPAPAPAAASGSMVQIVEIEKPDLRTSRVIAADGRVFVQSNANTITRWPETPFMVEIQMGTFGTTYLKVPGIDQRIRVAVE